MLLYNWILSKFPKVVYKISKFTVPSNNSPLTTPRVKSLLGQVDRQNTPGHSENRLFSVQASMYGIRHALTVDCWYHVPCPDFWNLSLELQQTVAIFIHRRMMNRYFDDITNTPHLYSTVPTAQYALLMLRSTPSSQKRICKITLFNCHINPLIEKHYFAILKTSIIRISFYLSSPFMVYR